MTKGPVLASGKGGALVAIYAISCPPEDVDDGGAWPLPARRRRIPGDLATG
jgi:hypothetical protein